MYTYVRSYADAILRSKPLRVTSGSRIAIWVQKAI